MWIEQNDEDWVEVGPFPKFLDALQFDNDNLIRKINEDYPGYLNLPVDRQNVFPIHLASKHGSLKTIVYLLNQFPWQLNQKDVFDQTPIFFAVKYGHIHIVQYLIDKEAILNMEAGQNSRLTPVIQAMQNDNHDIVYMLLNANALAEIDNVRLTSYQIALSWGIKKSCFNLMDILLSKRAFHQLTDIQQINLMAVAVQTSSLDVIKLLAKYSPGLLHEPNEQGKMPILWAVRRGDVDIIAYLVNEGVNVDIVVDQPTHKDHGKQLSHLAHDAGHYPAASFIIELIRDLYDLDWLFAFIKDAETAFEYIKLSPINALLILNNPRLKTLIENTGTDIITTPESTSYYRINGGLSKSPSSIFHINNKDGQVDEYFPKGCLGMGSNSKVREFVNLHGDKQLAVKTQKEIWLDAEQLTHELNLVNRELDFNNKAYQDKNIINNVYVCKKTVFFTLRTVIPYMGSLTAIEALKRCNTSIEMTNILLSMAEALMALHNKNIIHGDVKEDNAVMSSNNTISWVDFEWSYDLRDSSATWSPEVSYWAPERRHNLYSLKPDISQDVYSFASMLKRIQHNYPFIKFPAILEFIDKGLAEQPQKRPTLQSFCQVLSDEIEREKSAIASISANNFSS